MQNFYRFETDYPTGSGFSIFGLCHLTWIIFICIAVLGSSVWYLRLHDSGRQRAKRVLGSLLPIMGVYRDGVLFLTGHFDYSFLPFHLCSMALILACVYVWTGWRFCGVVYVMLCVPGAAGAILFPNWDAYPFWNYMHIHAFLSHGLTIVLGMWFIASGEVVPRWRELWMPIVFGICGFCILPYMNALLDTNFWFLEIPAHGSPMVLIYKKVGFPWYRLVYFLFCFIIVLLWQLLIRGGRRFFTIVGEWNIIMRI